MAAGHCRDDLRRDAVQSDEQPRRHRHDARASPTRSPRARGGGRSFAATTRCSARCSRSPLEHGADLSLYSLTKYVGGHSDLIGGAVLGGACGARSRSASCATPSARSSIRIPAGCWSRSLETLSLRMRRAASNAAIVAEYLAAHPKVARVHYPPLLPPDHPARALMARQSSAAGSTFSFDVAGRRDGGFRLFESAAAVQARGQPRRHGIADLPSRRRQCIPASPKRRGARSASRPRSFACRSA